MVAPFAAAIQVAWADFLARYRWQWFCTLTFSRPVHPEAADKRFRVWTAKLNRELFGPRWHKRPERTVYWVRALEWQRRQVIHFHALMGCASKDLNHHAIRRYWADLWNHLAGFARVDKIRHFDDVNEYVTKYTAKGGQIDLSPNLAVVQPITQDADLLDQTDGLLGS